MRRIFRGYLKWYDDVYMAGCRRKKVARAHWDTLTDETMYDEKRSRRIRNTVFLVCVFVYLVIWFCCHWFGWGE